MQEDKEHVTRNDVDRIVNHEMAHQEKLFRSMFDNVLDRLERMENKMDAGFAKMDARFDKLESRVGILDIDMVSIKSNARFGKWLLASIFALTVASSAGLHVFTFFKG